jgi:hypothetical protein
MYKDFVFSKNRVVPGVGSLGLLLREELRLSHSVIQAQKKRPPFFAASSRGISE